MPIYEYVCTDCRHEFEELVRATSLPSQPVCPKCSCDKVQRKLSVFSAQQGKATTAALPGGCQRCGDPDGPCAM